VAIIINFASNIFNNLLLWTVETIFIDFLIDVYWLFCLKILNYSAVCHQLLQKSIKYHFSISQKMETFLNKDNLCLQLLEMSFVNLLSNNCFFNWNGNWRCSFYNKYCDAKWKPFCDFWTKKISCSLFYKSWTLHKVQWII